ncbi:FG-GAP-like repeat-containing protein [Microbacterium sp. bgisy189]|uniref:FG-GAP-like repeat-containing protein n=1 Tax=Microbacterium sp. bgisy189 TaxID=3413798 RepID=UPI003EBA3F69
MSAANAQAASPESSPAPTAAATSEPAPTATPSVTETPEPVEEGDTSEHSDGPTMPLTRELEAGSLPALNGQSGTTGIQSRLAASYGPQPVFRFPFAPGYRWGISGSHADSDGIYRGAIDFAPLSSGATRVRAIAAGQVYRVSCSGGWFLGIDHGGGWMSEYYHLKDAKSSLVGEWVEAGTILGTAGQTLPCGGTPGASAHVHLSILNSTVDVPSGKRQYIPVSGIQFDRFLLTDSSGAYNGVWRDFSGKTVLTSRGVTCCLTADDRVGPTSPKAVLPDVDGNGIDDRSELVSWDTDLDGNGRPEIVGFGSKGVMVSNNTGTTFTSGTRVLSSFGQATGWSTSRHLRMVVDVTGDGDPDIVGFSDTGVFVAAGTTARGFAAAKRWSSQFGADDGWKLSHQVRTLADVTGDGLPDVVGFGSRGVSVAANTGGSFGASSRWLAAMGSASTAGDWNTTQHLRTVADVDGDGRADLVGFGRRGVEVARSTGTGFAQPTRWTDAFGADRGWRQDVAPRSLVDMNEDGLPDIVGFGRNGVYVALNTGTSFSTATRWSSSFGHASTDGAWGSDRDSRTLADVNDDGRPDIVGFRSGGVYVARNTGSSFTSVRRWTTDFGSKEWTLGAMPRSVVDVNGDGQADIVGYARHGVHVALNDGTRFRAAAHWSLDYGWGASTGNWQVRTKPRGISAG